MNFPNAPRTVMQKCISISLGTKFLPANGEHFFHNTQTDMCLFLVHMAFCWNCAAFHNVFPLSNPVPTLYANCRLLAPHMMYLGNLSCEQFGPRLDSPNLDS